MADGFISVAVDGVGKSMDMTELTVAGKVVERERVVVAGPTAADLAPCDSTNGLASYNPKMTGTWGYVANTLSAAGNVTGVGRCIGISVFANGVDSSFNIGGGNTITVRSGTGLDIIPYGNPSAPVVNWVSGTLDVIIEGLS